MLEGMQGMGGVMVKCEECGRHQATLNVDLGETWGEIALCGLCTLELILEAKRQDHADTAPTS